MVPATHAASREIMNSKPSFEIKVTNGEGVSGIAGSSWSLVRRRERDRLHQRIVKASCALIKGMVLKLILMSPTLSYKRQRPSAMKALSRVTTN